MKNVFGVIAGIALKIKEFIVKFNKIDKELERVNDRIDRHDRKFDKIDDKLEKHGERLNALDK